MERSRREVGLCRNNDVAVGVQKSWRKRKFSSWIGMEEIEALVGWAAVLLCGPGRW